MCQHRCETLKKVLLKKLKCDKIINWENSEHDFFNAELLSKSEIKQEIYHENAETSCYLLPEMKSGMPD